MTAALKLNSPSPDELWEMDRAHTLHPWTNFGPFEKDGSLIMARGEGCYLWDAEGRKYFDAVGGMWCTNIGLGRREMADAIADQVMRLGYSNYFVDTANEPASMLAAKLASLAPGDLNRVHFTTGGSTAVDTAVRMVSFYHHCKGNPQKTDIVARENSYHGSTYLCQSVGKRNGDRVDEFQMLIDRVGADRIGGFIAEPIQASGGIIIPPKGYLRRMWEVCQKHDILFIADEVVTAFGRIGHWFASEAEFGVVPDIITTAKGITSGYIPLGAMIFSDRIWDVMAKGGERWFTTGFTFAGHPVACRAALTNIAIMEREGLLAHASKVGSYFEERLQTLSDLPLVGNVRGKKLMLCTENVANKETKELLPDGVNESKRISDSCEATGLMVRPIGHLNVMSPALTITEKEVDFVVETLGKAIRKVTDDLVREGIRIG